MNRQPITHALCTEVGNFTHVVEASTLGLRPGEWPAALVCDRAFGNGLQLLRGDPELSADGELQAVNYRQALGVLSVRVFND